MGCLKISATLEDITVTKMPESEICSSCGEHLDGLQKLPYGENTPCPNCGSTARYIQVKVEDTIQTNDNFYMLVKTGHKQTRYRESAREGRISSVDQSDDGALSYSLDGSSPQGEEDTLSVGRRLVNALNESGGNWGNPVPGEGVADCMATNNGFPDRKLSIQVVRANVDQNMWKQLNIQGNMQELDISPEELADQIRVAIERKANEREIPTTHRKGLILALDATRLPAMGFEIVVKAFRAKYSSWIASLDFDSVWLVGPVEPLICCLDS